MTDREIISGLIARDKKVTTEFFFVSCRPLFYSIIEIVFGYEVDYDELVNELYVYLMENDAAKLRNFRFRSTVFQWLKVVAIRFFIQNRSLFINGKSHKIHHDLHKTLAPELDISAKYDLERFLEAMPNKRYVSVIRQLVLADRKPERVAYEMKTTTQNLYNIKMRAIAQLTSIALNDIKEYGK